MFKCALTMSNEATLIRALSNLGVKLSSCPEVDRILSKVIVIPPPERVNDRDWHGRTALHHACAELSFTDINKLMAIDGADVSLLDAWSSSPIHLFVKSLYTVHCYYRSVNMRSMGKIEDTLSLLLTRKCRSINVVDESHVTPLWILATAGDDMLGLLKILMAKATPYVNQIVCREKTGIWCAAYYRNPKVLHFLLSENCLNQSECNAEARLLKRFLFYEPCRCFKYFECINLMCFRLLVFSGFKSVQQYIRDPVWIQKLHEQHKDCDTIETVAFVRNVPFSLKQISRICIRGALRTSFTRKFQIMEENGLRLPTRLKDYIQLDDLEPLI